MKYRKRIMMIICALIVSALLIFRSTRKVSYHLDDTSTENHLHYTVEIPSFSNYHQWTIQMIAKTDNPEMIALKYNGDPEMDGKDLPETDWVMVRYLSQIASWKTMHIYAALEEQQLSVIVIADDYEVFHETVNVSECTGTESSLHQYTKDKVMNRTSECLLLTFAPDGEGDSIESDENELDEHDNFYVGIIFD